MVILVWVVGIVFVAAHADESFTKVAMDGHEGYVVPEEYAQRQDSSVRMHLAGKLVEAEYRQVSFWTPTVEQVKEAEKTVRKFIRKGAANPKWAFPNVAAYPDKFIPEALLLSGKEIGLVDRVY